MNQVLKVQTPRNWFGWAVGEVTQFFVLKMVQYDIALHTCVELGTLSRGPIRDYSNKFNLDQQELM